MSIQKYQTTQFETVAFDMGVVLNHRFFSFIHQILKFVLAKVFTKPKITNVMTMI